MAHTHDVHDTGKRFEINGISRFIKETSTTKLVLVQGDHKSEVVTFEMPRYIDGHDMLLCNKIRVHYINIETKTNNTSADIYEVTDLKLCEDCGEEETLLFTWTIEAQATKYFGSLSFLVKFECTEGDNILYQWNTARYVNINVLNGIDNSEAFVDKYSNVLEEWYNKLMGESETVANLVETVGQQLEDCEQATTNATKATNSCAEATENCISATEDAEAVRAEVEAGGFIESLKETNNGSKFSTWIGTQAEYDALGEKTLNCLYLLTDDDTAEKVDNIADYIVEQGMIDGWTYRKWNSGIAEMWLYAGSNETVVGDPSVIVCQHALPFSLKMDDGHYPVFNVSGFHYQHDECYITLAAVTPHDGVTSGLMATAMLKCIKPDNIKGYAWFSFYVMGMWK